MYSYLAKITILYVQLFSKNNKYKTNVTTNKKTQQVTEKFMCFLVK